MFSKKVSRCIYGTLPVKYSAFIAGHPLLQRVIKLAGSLTATSYPEGYT